MNRHSVITGLTKLVSGFVAALMLQPASAIEEIVVYGKRAELEIDRAVVRVDLTDYRKQLADSVRLALADTGSEPRPVRVASTDVKPRA